MVRPLYRGCNLNLWHCFCLLLVFERTKKQICNCGVVYVFFFISLFIPLCFSFARIYYWFLFAILCRNVHFISFFFRALRLWESSDVHSSSVQRLLFILVSPLRCKTFTVALDACTLLFLSLIAFHLRLPSKHMCNLFTYCVSSAIACSHNPGFSGRRAIAHTFAVFKQIKKNTLLSHFKNVRQIVCFFCWSFHLTKTGQDNTKKSALKYGANDGVDTTCSSKEEKKKAVSFSLFSNIR